MKYFLQSIENEDISYEVIGLDMNLMQVKLKGPLAEIVVSWADGDFSQYGYKLVTEAGSDAKLEGLQAELQARGEDSEASW